MEQIVNLWFILIIIIAFVIIFNTITNWIEKRQSRKQLEEFMKTELYIKMKADFEKEIIEIGKAIAPPILELTNALIRVSEEMQNFMTEDEWEPVDERLKEAIEEMNLMREGKMPKNTLEDLWKEDEDNAR